MHPYILKTLLIIMTTHSPFRDMIPGLLDRILDHMISYSFLYTVYFPYWL